MTPLEALLLYATLAELAIIVVLALCLIRTVRRSRDLGEFNLTDIRRIGQARDPATGRFTKTKDRITG